MQKRLFLLLIISLFSNYTFSQHSIKVFLLDSTQKTPINSVKVSNISDFSTLYSGFDGTFTVNFEKENIFLKLSHHSYKPKSVTISKFDVSPKYIYISRNDMEINEIISTASKTTETKNTTPYLLRTISNSKSKKNIMLSIDDFLRNNSTININRPQGIYCNSPIITTTGIGGVSGRTLIMYEGISMNKAYGGNANWNMFSASNIEKVEIISNSASTIYGNNAMGGVINFISKRPKKDGFHGFINIFGGSNNTYGADFGIYNKHKQQKGFYFGLNTFAQKSDGYIQTPDSLQNEDFEYLPLFLREIKTNFLLGYDFNLNNKIEIIYNFYNDKRGLGEKINEENGEFIRNNSHFFITKYTGNANKISWEIDLFAQDESYFRNIENLINENYSLIYVDSKRQDAGSNLFFNYMPMHKIQFTTGINLKYGFADNRNNYQTSSDIIINKGNLYSGDGFLQTKISPLNNNNLHIILGGNYNFTSLKNAEFSIKNQSETTEHLSDFTSNFSDNSFESFSFNTGFRFNFAKKLGIWTTFNSGFNSPTLEDMTRSGFTQDGFIEANPNLHSEHLYNTNYGIGYYSKRINLTIDGNYSIGNDFINYVSKYTPEFSTERIYQKQNISQVKIYNFNVDFNYKLKNLDFFTNYSYGNSKITSFDSLPELIGKNLTYSPHYKANAGFLLQLNKYNFSLIWHYKTKQYTNSENTKSIPSHYTIDFKVSTLLFTKLEVGLGINNILDYQYLNYANQNSIGRFMLFNMKYLF